MGGEKKMIIAIPTKNNKSCSDFSSCESIDIFSFKNNRVESKKQIKIPCQKINPSYEWINEFKIDMVITGTIDSNLNEYLKRNNIQAVTGAPIASPQILAEFYTI